jgi:hypothetical protein
MSWVLFDFVPFHNPIKKSDEHARNNTTNERKTPKEKCLLALKLTGHVAKYSSLVERKHVPGNIIRMPYFNERSKSRNITECSV